MVRGRYEASCMRSDCWRAIEEDSGAEDIVVVKVVAQNDTRKEKKNVLHKMTNRDAEWCKQVEYPQQRR